MKETNEKSKKMKTNSKKYVIIGGSCLILLTIAIGLFLYAVLKDKLSTNTDRIQKNHSAVMPSPAFGENEKENIKDQDEDDAIKEKKEEEELLIQENQKKNEVENLIRETQKLANGYFYEEAIERIKEYVGYESEERLMEAIAQYEKALDELVLYEGDINHVFFHSLIADNSKAFDGDAMSNGYNYWMTTVSEFNKILEQMYERGFILVDIHDIAGPIEVDGKIEYKKKDLYLPKGKKPFVLSQDDVNYYEYMKNDGFASRLVIDDGGFIACEIKTDQGVKVARDYDVVPLLDVFVEEHPDFSYQGAKGILALTGYEGALGYRTNDPNSPTYEQDKKTVKKLAKALKEDGWEFASHSYTHRHMPEISWERFKKDCDNWKKEVASLVGETDIYIYPYGEEIEYTGKKYEYLKEQGFNYFCGVYAKPWMQVGKDYIRMTRRNLDGFTMHFYPDRVKDLYDLNYVYDEERPEFK